MGLPKGVGLGVEPNWEVLGKPILSVQQEAKMRYTIKVQGWGNRPKTSSRDFGLPNGFLALVLRPIGRFWKLILSVQQESKMRYAMKVHSWVYKQANKFWEGLWASKRVFGIGVETIHKVFGQSTLSVIGDYQTVRLLGVANKRHGKREILAENFQDGLNLLAVGLHVQPDQSQSLLMGEQSHIILRER